MDRRTLGIFAIIIIVLMGVVATAGLDRLPARLRQGIQTASAQLSSDRARFAENRVAIEKALSEDPALFAAKAAQWRERLEGAQHRLEEAGAELAALQKLAEADRREDARTVEEKLARLDSLRALPVRETSEIRSEVERWLTYKRDLPRQLEQMRADYEAMRAFDVDAAAAPVRKAIMDWPAKQQDLEGRLNALRNLKSDAERVWQSTAAERQKAEAKQYGAVDYAVLFTGAEQLSTSLRQLREGSESANRLAQQLYVNWDKLVVDVDEDRQRVRLVRTRYPDASLKNGETSHEEFWESAGAGSERNLGLVIEHKPAGKYDFEAERGAQPPAYAYIAPPGQANAYGSWSNGVWHWLPQYLLMSQLLRNASYPPITTGDYFDYEHARRRGIGYYGRSWGGFSRRLPSAAGSARRTIDGLRSGGWWRERSSALPSGGGFRGSRYQSRGTFSGSRFQSRGFRSYSRSFGRSFGRGGRR